MEHDAISYNYSTLSLIAPCHALCRPTSHLSSPTMRGSMSLTNLSPLYLLFGVTEEGAHCGEMGGRRGGGQGGRGC